MSRRGRPVSIPPYVRGAEGAFAEAVREQLQVLTGQRGDRLNAAVTFNDMNDLGITDLRDSVNSVRSAVAAVQASPGSSDLSTPPKAVNLQVGIGSRVAVATWAIPNYGNHSHCLVYKAATDDHGLAVAVGSTPANIFSIALRFNETAYFWVSLVSKAGVEGPLNSTAGTMVQSVASPSQQIADLSDTLDFIHLGSAINDRLTLTTTNQSAIAQEVSDRSSAVSQEASDRAAALAAEADARAQAITNKAIELQANIDAVQQSVNNLAEQSLAQIYVQDEKPLPGISGVQDPIPDSARWYDSDDNNSPSIWIDLDFLDTAYQWSIVGGEYRLEANGGGPADLMINGDNNNPPDAVYYDGVKVDKVGAITGTNEWRWYAGQLFVSGDLVPANATTLTGHFWGSIADPRIGSTQGRVQVLEDAVTDPTTGLSEAYRIADETSGAVLHADTGNTALANKLTLVEAEVTGSLANEVPDPSFETGDISLWPNSSANISTEEAHTGTYSLKMSDSGLYRRFFWFDWSGGWPMITPGEKWTFGFWAKNTDSESREVQFPGPGAYTNGAKALIPALSDWTYYQFKLQYLTDQKIEGQFRFETVTPVNPFDSGAGIYIDDLRLVRGWHDFDGSEALGITSQYADAAAIKSTNVVVGDISDKLSNPGDLGIWGSFGAFAQDFRALQVALDWDDNTSVAGAIDDLEVAVTAEGGLASQVQAVNTRLDVISPPTIWEQRLQAEFLLNPDLSIYFGTTAVLSGVAAPDGGDSLQVTYANGDPGATQPDGMLWTLPDEVGEYLRGRALTVEFLLKQAPSGSAVSSQACYYTNDGGNSGNQSLLIPADWEWVSFAYTPNVGSSTVRDTIAFRGDESGSSGTVLLAGVRVRLSGAQVEDLPGALAILSTSGALTERRAMSTATSTTSSLLSGVLVGLDWKYTGGLAGTGSAGVIDSISASINDQGGYAERIDSLEAEFVVDGEVHSQGLAISGLTQTVTGAGGHGEAITGLSNETAAIRRGDVNDQWQGDPLTQSGNPHRIRFDIQNNQQAVGWHKLFEAKCGLAFHGAVISGVAVYGASAARYRERMEFNIQLEVLDPSTTIGQNTYYFKGDDLTSRLRAYRENIAGTWWLRVYTDMPSYSGMVIDAEVHARTLEGSYVDNFQGSADSVGDHQFVPPGDEIVGAYREHGYALLNTSKASASAFDELATEVHGLEGDGGIIGALSAQATKNTELETEIRHKYGDNLVYDPDFRISQSFSDSWVSTKPGTVSLVQGVAEDAGPAHRVEGAFAGSPVTYTTNYLSQDYQFVVPPDRSLTIRARAYLSDGSDPEGSWDGMVGLGYRVYDSSSTFIGYVFKNFELAEMVPGQWQWLELDKNITDSFPSAAFAVPYHGSRADHTQGFYLVSRIEVSREVVSSSVAHQALLTRVDDVNGDGKSVELIATDVKDMLIEFEDPDGQGTYASLSQMGQVYGSSLGDLGAKFGVTLDVNGYVTGFAQNNDGTTGTFTILADKFAVVDPSGGPGQTATVPFRVEGGIVYIDGARIDELNADIITAGTLRADRYIVNTTEWDCLCDDASIWEVFESSGSIAAVNETQPGAEGGTKSIQITGAAPPNTPTLVRAIDRFIPYDPNAEYEIRALVRHAGPTSNGAVYVGFIGYAADKVTMVNLVGDNQSFSQHYVTAANVVPNATPFSDYKGYIKGWAATGGGDSARGGGYKAHSGVRWMRPIIYMGYGSSANEVVHLSRFTVRRVNPYISAGNSSFYLGPGSIHDDLIANNITANKITTGTLNAARLNLDGYNLVIDAQGLLRIGELDSSQVVTNTLSADTQFNVEDETTRSTDYVAGEVFDLATIGLPDTIGAGAQLTFNTPKFNYDTDGDGTTGTIIAELLRPGGQVLGSYTWHTAKAAVAPISYGTQEDKSVTMSGVAVTGYQNETLTIRFRFSTTSDINQKQTEFGPSGPFQGIFQQSGTMSATLTESSGTISLNDA